MNSGKGKTVTKRKLKLIGRLSDAFTIYGDSDEVMKGYFDGRIRQLEYTLNALNIQEHSQKIVSICQQIIILKKKYSFYT